MTLSPTSSRVGRGVGPQSQATIAMVGDSISGQNTDGTQNASPTIYYAQGYLSWANVLLRHRLVLVNGNAYTHSGYTTADLITNGLVAGAAASSAEMAIVHAGTNDVGQAVSAATIAANLQAIWNTLIGAGKTVIATTILPRDLAADTAPERQALRDANHLIRSQAAATPGVLLCDWYDAMVTASTGLAVHAYFRNEAGSYVHPNAVGASRMGAVLAQMLSPLLGIFEDLGGDNVDTSNMCTNGTMAGNTAGVATNWSVFDDGAGTHTASKASRTDLHPGEWQQLAVVAADPDADGCHLQFQNTNVGTDWNVGDQVYAAIEFELDPAGADVRHLALFLTFFNGVGSISELQQGSSDITALSETLWLPTSGVLRTPTSPVLATTTRLQLQAYVRGNVTIRFGRAQIINVTKV